jgi:hypothetical protein
MAPLLLSWISTPLTSSDAESPASSESAAGGNPPGRFRFYSSIVLALLVLTLIALSLLPSAGSVVGRIRGSLSARIDVRRGHLEIKSFGEPPAWHEEYRRLLREKYGVAVDTSAGCCPSRSDHVFMESYNGVSGPAILEKFGKDVFRECRNAARKGKGEEEEKTCPCTRDEK